MIKTKFSSLNLEHVSKMTLLNYKNCFSTFLILIMLGFGLAPRTVFAAEDVIAILDLAKVMELSKARIDASKQLKSLEETIRADGKASEAKLKEEQEAINRQRVILAPEAFEQKKIVFNKKALAFRNDIQTKLKQLAYTRAMASKKIEKAMEPIVIQVAKSVGATMIIDRRQILFGENNLDISDRVTESLNKKLTKVDVTLLPLPKK